MRRVKLYFVLLSLWFLAGCAQGGNSDNEGRLYTTKGTTGYANPQGIPYVNNGDKRMDRILSEPVLATPPEPLPAATPHSGSAASPPTPKSPTTLVERLKEYEISRFMAGAKKPSRFGNKTFTIKIFFIDQADATVFSGDLQRGQNGNYTISVDSGNYSLKGTFTDTIPYKTDGDLSLTDNSKKTNVRILYRAYKAQLRVREDRTRKLVQGSSIERQLKDLRENTFGWVNNWSVVHGKSFYLVDIIKVVSGDDDSNTRAPLFAFKGESLQTGEQQYDAETVKDPDTTAPDFATGVKLVGNGEEDGLRVYSAEIEDKQSAEKYQFMLDVEEQTQDTKPGTPPSDDSYGDDNSDYDQPPTDKDSTEPVTPVKPHVGKSYLAISLPGPQITRMTRDFARNRNLPGVIAQTKNKALLKRLNNFYFYAYPFKPFLESVSESYDISPIYAYLTVRESPKYLSDGKYRNEKPGDGGRAVGPFQMHPDAAADAGVWTNGKQKNDERWYFAPSACGAAKYMVIQFKKFQDSDTTLAILGYNQGAQGAFNLAKRFGYTYARMSRSSSVSKAIREYVDQVLAVYFISSDLQAFGFQPNNYVNSLWPTNKTVMPPAKIKDSICQAIAEGAEMTR